MRLIDADAIEKELGVEDRDLYVQHILDSAPTIEADPKGSFYDGYAYCLMDFGKNTVLCRDCKHWNGETHGCERHPSVEPWWETDSCNYGERKDEVEE